MKNKIKRNRAVGKGFDVKKIVQIWAVLTEANTWLHVAEISRRTGIDECTVRWYLDRYLKDAINEERVVPTIRLRLVMLKPGMELESYIKALTLINKLKEDKPHK